VRTKFLFTVLLAVALVSLAGCTQDQPVAQVTLTPTLSPLPTPTNATSPTTVEKSTPEPTATPGLDFPLIEEAWQKLLDNYVDSDDLDPHALTQGAIEGMLEALDDPYSFYIDSERWEMIHSNLQGAFGGIGAEVTTIDSLIAVSAVLKGTPAEASGVLPGDTILEVDGVSTEGMTLDEAVTSIRGRPGTDVTLGVMHHGNNTPIDIVITRAIIELESVYYEMLPDDVAYVQVTAFTDRTTAELLSALTDMFDQGATGIVLDLRNNPGGILSGAVSVASQFLDEGRVLYSVDNEGKVTEYEVEDGGIAPETPLAVLVNGHSASGAEVVAGAIQDHERGPLIGTRTFGKGSVNLDFILSDGSAMRLTIQRWYTPTGHQIEGNGLTPDIDVSITPEDREEGRDPQLDAAVEYVLGEK
jgi:carboxyl-terminal processing protease